MSGKKAIMKKLVAVVVILFTACTLMACSDPTTDKAYNAILESSKTFKDPSSVRIISGGFHTNSDGNEWLCVALSANNSYGARGTEYYLIMPGYPDPISSDAELVEYAISKEINNQEDQDTHDQYLMMLSDDSLDYDKINKQLAEYWKNF